MEPAAKVSAFAAGNGCGRGGSATGIFLARGPILILRRTPVVCTLLVHLEVLLIGRDLVAPGRVCRQRRTRILGHLTRARRVIVSHMWRVAARRLGVAHLMTLPGLTAARIFRGNGSGVLVVPARR